MSRRRISQKKQRLLSQLREEVENGNVGVRSLFEFFYGEISKASARNIQDFLASHKKLEAEILGVD